MFRRLRRAFGPMMSASMATMLQYRGEVLLWALWGVVFPAVSMTLWSAASRSRPLAGLTGEGPIAAYFLLVMVVGHLTTSWDVFELGYLVRSGEMSPRLLRPMLPIWNSIADNISYKIVTMAVLVPIWLLAAWHIRPEFATRGIDLALGLPALGLAMALAYVWGYILALLAFVMTKVESAAEAYFGLSMFLGGQFAALDWLPWPLAALSWCFPFRWKIAFPVELLLGKLSVSEAWFGLAMQTAWLVAGIVIYRFAWRAGVRKYSAVGA